MHTVIDVVVWANTCRAYFSQDGIEYGIGRVPMGGTDFSTRKYTYDDLPGDVGLSQFSLAKEDLFYKVFQLNHYSGVCANLSMDVIPSRRFLTFIGLEVLVQSQSSCLPVHGQLLRGWRVIITSLAKDIFCKSTTKFGRIISFGNCLFL